MFSFYRFDCKHFELPEPDFSSAVELKQDIDTQEAMWTLYDEFIQGLTGIENEEWIVFRYVIYLVRLVPVSGGGERGKSSHNRHHRNYVDII